MGVGGTDRSHLIRTMLDASGQRLFFTAGEKEVRTWLLPKGGTALEAAAGIHTDLARGFIRAEVMTCARPGPARERARGQGPPPCSAGSQGLRSPGRRHPADPLQRLTASWFPSSSWEPCHAQATATRFDGPGDPSYVGFDGPGDPSYVGFDGPGDPSYEGFDGPGDPSCKFDGPGDPSYEPLFGARRPIVTGFAIGIQQQQAIGGQFQNRLVDPVAHHFEDHADPFFRPAAERLLLHPAPSTDQAMSNSKRSAKGLPSSPTTRQPSCRCRRLGAPSCVCRDTRLARFRPPGLATDRPHWTGWSRAIPRRRRTRPSRRGPGHCGWTNRAIQNNVPSMNAKTAIRHPVLRPRRHGVAGSACRLPACCCCCMLLQPW